MTNDAFFFYILVHVNIYIYIMNRQIIRAYYSHIYNSTPLTNQVTHGRLKTKKLGTLNEPALVQFSTAKTRSIMRQF